MLNWLKGWKGIAVGAVFIVLSLIYNSIFKTQIAESVLLQIPGYFLIGIGSTLVMYAALASSDPKKEESESLSEESCDTEQSEETTSEEDNL